MPTCGPRSRKAGAARCISKGKTKAKAKAKPVSTRAKARAKANPFDAGKEWLVAEIARLEKAGKKWRLTETIRLGAEHLDAERTLSKIEKLEQQLLKAKTQKDHDTPNANVRDLQLQLDILQAKLLRPPSTRLKYPLDPDYLRLLSDEERQLQRDARKVRKEFNKQAIKADRLKTIPNSNSMSWKSYESFKIERFKKLGYFGYVYPKCVTSRGKTKYYASKEPTEAWVNALAQTILPAIKFSSSARPLKVPGGYAITGSHKFKDGDKLIEAIDTEIAKSRPTLKDQMTVLYTPRYGSLNINMGEDMKPTSNREIAHLMADAGNEPFLYITGPNIVQNSNPVFMEIVSISGLVASWHLIMDDMSVPLFVCFIGLQLAHEGAHVLTARSKGVKLSFPIFVPSPTTGITSTVTTFKTLPKNKNDMFDIAAAGPLAGIVVSSLTLAIGAKLTLMSNPATLPALPLDSLRQSTLGGAIIDKIIKGSLYFPPGVPTAGMIIPLHPFGIAGYFGLIVNALALLPIGSK